VASYNYVVKFFGYYTS